MQFCVTFILETYKLNKRAFIKKWPNLMFSTSHFFYLHKSNDDKTYLLLNMLKKNSFLMDSFCLCNVFIFSECIDMWYLIKNAGTGVGKASLGSNQHFFSSLDKVGLLQNVTKMIIIERNSHLSIIKKRRLYLTAHNR